MSDYSRAEVTISYGATSALQDPDFERTFTSTPSSPTKYLQLKVSAATGGGTTVELGTFTTVLEVYVSNTDTTNYVVATATSSATCGVKIIAGQWAKLTAVDPSADLVLAANTAACVCEVLVIGT